MVSLFLIGCKAPHESAIGNQGADAMCSIGVFSGGIEEEKQLHHLLDSYGIRSGLEGSVFYDIYVPVSDAATASNILRTNSLTLDGKVRLYTMPSAK
jgi:hypothetical protein